MGNRIESEICWDKTRERREMGKQDKTEERDGNQDKTEERDGKQRERERVEDTQRDGKRGKDRESEMGKQYKAQRWGKG